jgi:hypothetical protein
MNAAAGEFAPRPSAPASRVRAFVIDIVLNVVLPYAGYAACGSSARPRTARYCSAR